MCENLLYIYLCKFLPAKVVLRGKGHQYYLLGMLLVHPILVHVNSICLLLCVISCCIPVTFSLALETRPIAV